MPIKVLHVGLGHGEFGGIGISVVARIGGDGRGQLVSGIDEGPEYESGGGREWYAGARVEVQRR